MSTQDLQTDSRILSSLPSKIHAAIMTYAAEAELEPSMVIEGAVKYFLDVDTSLSSEAELTCEEASLLSELPPIIQHQAKEYAARAKIPAELVIELGIAHFLDPDSVTFDDCQVKVERGSIAWLKQYANSASVPAA